MHVRKKMFCTFIYCEENSRLDRRKQLKTKAKRRAKSTPSLIYMSRIFRYIKKEYILVDN